MWLAWALQSERILATSAVNDHMKSLSSTKLTDTGQPCSATCWCISDNLFSDVISEQMCSVIRRMVWLEGYPVIDSEIWIFDEERWCRAVKLWLLYLDVFWWLVDLYVDDPDHVQSLASLVQKWVKIVGDVMRDNIQEVMLCLLRHALGTEDIDNVSCMLNIDMPVPYIDDTTVILQVL